MKTTKKAVTTVLKSKATRVARPRKPRPEFRAYAPKPNGPREITPTNLNALHEKLRVLVNDDPGPGGANHDYRIVVDARLGVQEVPIRFQKGPVQEDGVNGLSNESLLVIVRDRLEGFQSGPFACKRNDVALTGVNAALDALQNRTADRVARGVEGTSKA